MKVLDFGVSGQTVAVVVVVGRFFGSVGPHSSEVESRFITVITGDISLLFRRRTLLLLRRLRLLERASIELRSYQSSYKAAPASCHNQKCW